MMLFNQAGTIIVSISTDTQGIASVPQLFLEGGVYTLRVVGDFGGGAQETTFELALISTASSPAVATETTSVKPVMDNIIGIPIQVGDSLENELRADGEIHVYSFRGVAGMRISFGLSRLGEATFDPYLELKTANGETIARSDNYADSLDALVINFALPVTGVYTLTAGSATGQGTGHYLIAIGAGFILRDVERGPAVHNQPIIARLEAYGTRDVWQIEIAAGDSISVSVEKWGAGKNGPFDPMTELVGPGGDTLAFDDDSGANKNAFLTSIAAPASGTYRIHIAAYDHATVGTYRLWWQRDNALPTLTPVPPTATPLVGATIGTNSPISTRQPTATMPATPAPLAGAMGSELIGIEVDETAIRRVYLEPGQVITVFVEGHWGFDPIVEIYTPDGYMMDRVDDVGFDQTFDINPRLTLTAQESGDYLLYVYGYEYSGGEFTLHWRIE
jgi:hypothetical protein